MSLYFSKPNLKRIGVQKLGNRPMGWHMSFLCPVAHWNKGDDFNISRAVKNTFRFFKIIPPDNHSAESQ